MHVVIFEGVILDVYLPTLVHVLQILLNHANQTH